MARFGLGSAEKVDRIEVLWPDGLAEIFGGVAANNAVVLTRGDLGDVEHLPTAITARAAVAGPGAPQIPGSALADIEKYVILKTLESTGGSTSKAAKVLGISVRKIQYKLQEYQKAPKSHVEAVAKHDEAIK